MHILEWRLTPHPGRVWLRFPNGRAKELGILPESWSQNHLPEAEKGTIRIIQEAGAMVGAGGESTSQTLTAMAYCLIAEPYKMQKLRDELRTVMPTPDAIPSLKELEQLPYLVRSRYLR